MYVYADGVGDNGDEYGHEFAYAFFSRHPYQKQHVNAIAIDGSGMSKTSKTRNSNFIASNITEQMFNIRSELHSRSRCV